MTSPARSATRPSPVFRECDGAPWPSDDELEMDAAWAALRQSAAVEWYDGVEAEAVAPSRVPGPPASEARMVDERIEDEWLDADWLDAEWLGARRSAHDQTVSDLDARLGHLEIVAAERQRSTAEEYRLIAAILARAAADPTPWVGPDPTRDPDWIDPRGRRTAAVRRDRVDIAERAAVAEIAVRLHLSEQTVRLRAARAETLQDRCPQMWRAFADGRVSERHAIETARLAGSLPGVGEIVDPDEVDPAPDFANAGETSTTAGSDASAPSGSATADIGLSELVDTDATSCGLADAGQSGSAPADAGHSGSSPADAGHSGSAPADAGHSGSAPADAAPPGSATAGDAPVGSSDVDGRRADPATVVWRAFDSAVRERATDLVPAKFAVAARAIRERVHAESLERRHRRAAEDRGVWMTAELDGMASLNALLPADRARGMMARIDRIARHLRATPDEDRTLAQLRADALSDLVNSPASDPISSAAHGDADADGLLDPSSGTRAGGAGTTYASEPAANRSGGDGRPGGDGRSGGDDQPGSDRRPGSDHRPASDHRPGSDRRPGSNRRPGGDRRPDAAAATPRDSPATLTASADRPSPRASRPTVIVTIPALALLGHSTEPATLDGYGPIDLDTARRLAGDATSWVRLLTHPIDGTPLALDRKTYRVPVALRRWLGVTSPTCVFPGCGRAAADCDIDHRDAWAEGGTTDDDNLDPTCRHHHRLKHESGWMPTSTPDAGLTWTSPLGGFFGADPPPF